MIRQKRAEMTTRAVANRVETAPSPQSNSERITAIEAALPEQRRGRLFYYRLPDHLSKEDKLEFLRQHAKAISIRKPAAHGGTPPSTIPWKRLSPNAKHTWLRSDTEDEFAAYLPIGSKDAKKISAVNPQVIFKTYSRGVITCRDQWVYDFRLMPLAERMRRFVDDYNSQVDKYKRQNPKPNVDDFADYERIKWDGTLKTDLRRANYGHFDRAAIRDSLYRPFTKKQYYFDRQFSNSIYLQPYFFPNLESEAENRVIICSDIAYRAYMFSTILSNAIPDVHLNSSKDAHQTFPFYTYDADGSKRRENITDFALEQFRKHYADPAISKWDIFYYVYGLLHHPGYRERYALDLKRNLPRIPFAPAFRPYAESGEKLAEQHLNYESADRYELDWQTVRSPVNYRVEKMLPKGKVDAADGSYKVYSTLKYNDSLSLHGIPERAFAYRLGNRSALDWVVDQYRVKTDKRSGITHDPNGASADEQYILKLIERVITVSLRTMDIVDALAQLPFRDGGDSATRP